MPDELIVAMVKDMCEACGRRPIEGGVQSLATLA